MHRTIMPVQGVIVLLPENELILNAWIGYEKIVTGRSRFLPFWVATSHDSGAVLPNATALKPTGVEYYLAKLIEGYKSWPACKKL
ncbi:MAG: hypothetical protein KME45_05685 [Stenomitos rutilans HA7619-LM2]|jgi:hypothetical protein|nr:hypothetical protein [Stenomitos rutilans HA7619-LM2]